MGEYAEMILDGSVCEICGEYMGDGDGYPQRCDDCHVEITKLELEDEIK